MARRLGGRSARLLDAFLSMVRKQREIDAAHSWFSPFCILILPGTLSCDSASVTFRVVFPSPLKLETPQQTRPRVCLLGDSKFSQVNEED